MGQIITPAIYKQPNTPGITESNANINIDGNIICGGQIQPGTVNATGGVSSLTSLSAPSIFRSNLELGLIGALFPVGANNNQKYWHTTYNSSFTYDTAVSLWRQDAPGTFDGSFPTVASADNSVAPKIEVKRLDLDGSIYFWDGANWRNRKSNTVIFPALARIIDDSTARAPGYNTLITAIGVNTLGGAVVPANATAIYGKITLISSAASGNLIGVIDNPDSITGTTAISGYSPAIGASVTGMFICYLSSAGQIKFTLNGTNISRYVVDVVGYQTGETLATAIIPTGGLTFPASPIVGQRFFRSDRAIEYYWDGAKWLSTQEFVLGMATFDQFLSNQIATNNSQMATRPHQAYSLYVTGFEAAFKTSSPLSSTVNWNITLYRTDNTGAIATLGPTIITYNLAKGFTAAGTLYADGVAPNVVITPAQSLRFFINVAKVSTPGNLELSGCVIRYRCVG